MRVFPVNILTLMHLGANQLELFKNDLDTLPAKLAASFSKDKHMIIGKPAPALLPYSLK